MTREHDVVFLFDVDYTLLDNGHVERDLREHLSRWLSAKARDRYFEIFEQIRHDVGYADFLGALERYRIENLHDTRVLKMSIWLVDYPFAQRLYPDSVDVVEHVRRWGPAVILSDGDAVFQPRKVERSGLRLLAAIKQFWGKRVTTVFVKQGHYANDPEILARYPPADIQVDRIGDLLNYDLAAFLKE